MKTSKPVTDKKSDPVFYDTLCSVAQFVRGNPMTLYETITFLWFSFHALYLLDKTSNSPVGRETPNSPDLPKIAKKLGIPYPVFFNALSKFKSSKPLIPISKGKEITINSPEVKEIIDLWNKNMDSILTITEKLEISGWIKTYPAILEIFQRFFDYQNEFKEFTLADRLRWYLFGKTFGSLQRNIDKFADAKTYEQILIKHRERSNILTRKENFGFSVDSEEDRKLALEDEREKICLALQKDLPYQGIIVFPENILYYNKKFKKATKEN